MTSRLKIVNKKKILCILLLALVIPMFAGCEGYNKQLIDTTYNFDKVEIKTPSGEIISGKVESWRDFEDGDQLQIKINGVTYLTHASNVLLISGGK